MERDIILNGVHIGEHSFEPDRIIDEIYERCVKPGLNFVTIRTPREQVPQEYFIRWAEYLAENRIYFVFLYTVQMAPAGKESQFTAETVQRIREIAGEYFIGDMLGETGSSFACKFAGYYKKKPGAFRDRTQLKTDYPDMKAAHEGYVRDIGKYIAIERKLGMPDIVSVEATGLNKYNTEAGVTVPMLELMCGDPEVLVSSLRGTARAFDAKRWGTYVAHEWYGGMRHDDPLKRKRLELAYKYAYLAGSQAFCLESGDELIESFGHRFEADSDICADYRRVLTDMMDFIRSDVRPAGGPTVKAAFVSGLHDAWGGWGGSSLWNQFHREEWGHGEAEHSWRLVKELGTRRSWSDIANYGRADLSAAPAWGQYDIVPIEADVEKLSRYDCLIFLGWNSMTEENMEKLTEYVRRGGRLLMTAAHLNRSAERGGAYDPVGNDLVETLFGARFTGETRCTNDGVKFRFESADASLLYPGTKSFCCDPLYSAGYVNYGSFTLSGGRETAFLSDSFMDDPGSLPAVIEHPLGSGMATLVTAVSYPGHPGLYPLYRDLAREMLTAGARRCEVQVLCGDRVRWAAYEGGKLYMLNTDYDLPAPVKILRCGREQTLTLQPMELRAVEA